METIYFDNAATTRVHDSVREEMARAESDLFFNSAALYAPSLLVRREIERAAGVIERKISRTAGAGEVVFTSGATEGNNMVIFGKITSQRQHLIVVAGEHSSIYAPSVYLKNAGFDVDYVPLSASGEIDISALRRLVRPNTSLLCFGMVNSDTGFVQNVGEVVRAARSVNPRIHVHCDAVQAFCKFNFDADVAGLDSVVVSAHKINGPKGVGAIWLRKGVSLRPIMYGGAQQDYRPGTENNAGILGFARAVEVFDTAGSFNKVKALHEILVSGLPSGCRVNGSNINPYITNIQLPGVLGSTVMNALSERGICVGLGSACAATASKNRTLLAMGISEARTKQVLRVSFGVYNSAEEVRIFLAALSEVLVKLG